VTIEHHKKIARLLLKRYRSGDPKAAAFVQRHHPRPRTLKTTGAFKLADALSVVARDQGFASWPRFLHALGRRTGRPPALTTEERAAISDDLVFVEGTHGDPFFFGEGAAARPIEIADFYVARVPVTNALWTRVMNETRRCSKNGNEHTPVEYVSWDDIAGPDGFLVRLNRIRSARFRLLTETEWEYVARGGRHWRDRFRYAGSNDIDEVAWYDRNSRRHIHPVAQKAPNQLGVYDMSGNVWEWCQDSFTRDTSQIPPDGAAFSGSADERVVRGGCFNNWAMHCTVSKRYEIARDCGDESIGLRLAVSAFSARAL
jgi:formylglycine-generating enzyme